MSFLLALLMLLLLLLLLLMLVQVIEKQLFQATFMNQHTGRARKANLVMVLKYLLFHQYGQYSSQHNPHIHILFVQTYTRTPTHNLKYKCYSANWRPTPNAFILKY